ncbi:ABC transporter permease [Enterococcus faecium]|uniref:ABC transporter permease n=1 Tax=Enterococcus faecium TaxID=1352 RepID=UPI001E3A7636|nr:ABC transporter permease [Enterococcus faecium]EME8219053.1 ABC transporter permease subunit [Enterococcus faecium]MCD4990242.1 ABC transporter permease subunit [Enterococcus faecium]
MTLLVKQELFKLIKKKSTAVLSVLLVVLLIGTALLAKKYTTIIDPVEMTAQLFSATSWIVFIMIAAASTIISMEAQYGTLKNLLYRKYSRGEILVSKWITLVIYSVYLYLLAIIVTVLMKLILFPSISFTEKVSTGQTLIQSLFTYTLGSYIGLWLILSLVLMIACFINSSGASISAGIVFYFASSITSGILIALIQKWEWIKWNPISMLNLQNQIGNEEIMKQLTHLSTNQMLFGNLAYIVLFLALGYLVFKRKNV